MTTPLLFMLSFFLFHNPKEAEHDVERPGPVWCCWIQERRVVSKIHVSLTRRQKGLSTIVKAVGEGAELNGQRQNRKTKHD
jgi:hypothetical protein